MKRRIIAQKDSFTITLPKKWASEKGLHGGLEVDVSQTKEGNLLIQTQTLKQGLEKHITLTSHSPSRLRTLLSGLYRQGYAKITIESTQAFDLEQIESLIQTIHGLLLMRFDKHVVVFHVTTSSEPDIAALLNKFFFLMSHCVELKAKKHTQPFDTLRKQALELRDYASRSIGLHEYGADKVTEYQLLVFFLEKAVSKVTALTTLDKTLLQTIDQLRQALMKNDAHEAQRLNTLLSVKAKEQTNVALALLYDHLFSVSSRIVSIVS